VQQSSLQLAPSTVAKSPSSHEDFLMEKNKSTVASAMQDSFSPPHIRMSGTEIRPKEVVLILLALALLVFSIWLFLKHWSKNYRDINSLPYYAYLYKVIAALSKGVLSSASSQCYLY